LGVTKVIKLAGRGAAFGRGKKKTHKVCRNSDKLGPEGSRDARAREETNSLGGPGLPEIYPGGATVAEKNGQPGRNDLKKRLAGEKKRKGEGGEGVPVRGGPQ